MVVSPNILDEVEFRPAKKIESRKIAELFSIASDGVADYIWSLEAEEGENLLDVAERRYENEDYNFSYKNCVIAEVKGEIAGMVVTSPLIADQNFGFSEADPVLIPYLRLEQYDSYYIWGVALYEKFRGQGIGTAFMEIAELKARESGYDKLSLLVFEENTGALKLYSKLGFNEVSREKVVPDPMIKYSGDVILMVKNL